MTTTVARPNMLPTVAGSCTIATAITTATDSDIGDRRSLTGPCDLVVTYTDLGATQTITVDIKGSSDGTNWWNIPYAVVATPSTFAVSQITYNTSGTNVVHYLLQGGQPWRYLRLTTSAPTNMQLDAVAYFYAP